MTKSSPPGARADYKTFHALTTRWGDNDVYGHVNNVIAYALFDSVVNGHLVRAGVLDVETSPAIGLVVETSCRYHAPMAFPDVIHAGLRVGHLGRSSVAYEIGLFRNDEDLAAAEGRFVHVYVDRAGRRPCPIPEATRRLLESIAV